MTGFLWIISLLTISVLACKRTSISVASIGMGTLLLVISSLSSLSPVLLSIIWLVFAIIAILLNVTSLRLACLTKPLLAFYQRVQPKMSTTEQEAIAAGTVDWDAQLFAGIPAWNHLLSQPVAKLSEEEQAFLDGPVEELCRMLDDWDITHNRTDLPPEVWQFLKEQGFFGLIIPKQYGGKQFSAYAHSRIIVKVAGVSVTASSTISVPNSLGPAELLLHYGTAEQKHYYLPRLASGQEVPCFALTGPMAGSDAGAMQDFGIICKGKFDGKEVLGMRVTWDKRYITLAPVATVLGLAFRLYDPDHLLGDTVDIGITCALIPVTTAGVRIGRRHFPLNAPFQNGPTQGQQVFIPLDWIIGGVAMAGHGWRMLMECLAAGRAISLPSAALGGAKLAVATSSAYARLRHQFKMPIGAFEGVQEALGRMVGMTYIIDATEGLTTAFIDQGQKPAVLSAIAKYHCTELGRKIANDAMDIHGGKGICLGPKNYLGRSYQSVPISITVEGANILTRNMIIFGQGALRCHPYALAEMQAANLDDPQQALLQFDKAIFGHIGYTISNYFRAFIHGVTGGRLLPAPAILTKRYFQYFSRFSAAFALLADTSMLALGGSLKRREMLSARLGDVLSYLYLGSAVLKRFDDQGRLYTDLPLVQWSCDYLLHEIQTQIQALLNNFPNRFLRGILRLCVFPLGEHFAAPSDKLQMQLAQLIQIPSLMRDRLIAGAYLTNDGIHPAGQLEYGLMQAKTLEPLLQIIDQARHEKKIAAGSLVEQAQHAHELQLISDSEFALISDFDMLVHDIIAVDDFAPEELARVMMLVDTEGHMIKGLMQ